MIGVLKLILLTAVSLTLNLNVITATRQGKRSLLWSNMFVVPSQISGMLLIWGFINKIILNNTWKWNKILTVKNFLIDSNLLFARKNVDKSFNFGNLMKKQ